MFTYKGSTALITGASKGLGLIFAEELARRGADLVLVARSKDALQTLAARLTAQYGVKCYVIAADLADSRTVDDIYAELAEQGVQIDLLVNNAGLGLSGQFLEHDHAKEQASIQVNIQALVGLSHRFGRAMSSRGRGGIINIASNSAFQPLPYMATYAASKAFVLHFSEALQHELSPRGVRVMTACPGPTATSFFEGTPTTMSDRSFDTPEMVVRGILRAFDQGKPVAYPGRPSVRFATWLPRLLPRGLIVRLAAMATEKMGLALRKADSLPLAADIAPRRSRPHIAMAISKPAEPIHHGIEK
jgi:short-subunit dehydrogenase